MTEGEGRQVPSPVTTASPQAQLAAAQPTPTLEQHEAKKRELENLREQGRLGFARFYAYGLVIGLGVQVVIADTAFFFYGFWNHWIIPSAAIEVWLAATVVQVIGVVLVIVRSLFPSEPSE